MFSFFWVISLPLKISSIWEQTIRICRALVMTENLSKTTFLLVQIGPWSMPAGCEELARGLKPIRNGEIFCVK